MTLVLSNCFFPSYKVLASLDIYFQFVPCPLLIVPILQHPESHFFAFAYAVLIGKPLPFVLWWVPVHFLRCRSGVWKAVPNHCLHWVGCPFSVLLGYQVSATMWFWVSCPGAITRLSYQAVIPEHRNCLSCFVSPALGRYFKQSWKLTFFWVLALSHAYPRILPTNPTK